MKSFFISVMFAIFIYVPVAYAALPQFPDTSVAYDIIEIAGDLHLEQEFYGTLTGNPHMYEFMVSTTTVLAFAVGQNAADATMLPLAYIVVEALDSGKVEEITRVRTSSSDRHVLDDRVLGISFLDMPDFSQKLEPGTYQIEISNLENLGRYRLVIGNVPVINGYISTWKRIWSVHAFFNQLPVGLLSSIFVLMHLFLGIFGVMVWKFGYPWWSRRRTQPR